MKRDIFINNIEKFIDEVALENIDETYIRSRYKGVDGKNGIYMLYDQNNVVVYVGRVGNGKQTSFCHRMYDHGTGAHKNEYWFGECKKFKIKRFPKAKARDLQVIERLMIYKKGQPKYNDIANKQEPDYEDIFQRVGVPNGKIRKTKAEK